MASHDTFFFYCHIMFNVMFEITAHKSYMLAISMCIASNSYSYIFRTASPLDFVFATLHTTPFLCENIFQCLAQAQRQHYEVQYAMGWIQIHNIFRVGAFKSLHIQIVLLICSAH